MSTRRRVFSVPVRLSIKAFNEQDAIKESNNALTEGLIEPGFCEDAGIEDLEIYELESVEGD